MNLSRRLAAKLAPLFVVAIAILGQQAGSVKAANDTWVGNTSALWSNGLNWSAGAPTTSGTVLLFGAAGSSGTTLTDDLMTPGTYTLSGITFNAGAAAFTINPSVAGTNGFTLAGGVTNSSTATQTINDLIAMTAVQTFTMTTGGGNIVLGGNVSGTGGGITLAGAGTLTLSGNNTYTGATTIGAGTTLIAGSTTGLSSSSALSIAASGAMALNMQTFNNTVASLTMQSPTAANTLTISGTGVLSTNSVLFAGGGLFTSTITGGTINLGSGGTVDATGVINNTATVRVLASNLQGSNINLKSGNLVNGGGMVQINGTNTSLTGNVNLFGMITFGSQASASNQTLNIAATNTGILANVSLALSNAITLSNTMQLRAYGGQTLTLNGIISGAGGITNVDTGVEVFGNVNTYTGTTTLTAGGYTISSTGVLGAGATGTAITVSGGTFNDNSTVAVTGGLTGTTSLTLSGGTTNLNTLNSYTGITSLLNATLVLGNNSALGSTSQLSINGTGSAVVQSSVANLVLPNTVQVNYGSSWTVSGANAITINGALTNFGATTLTNSITGGNILTLAGAVNIAEAPTTSRTLILSGAGNTTISGVIANAASATTAVGSLTYSGTGTLTLTNTETYKGATTISSGTVVLGSGGNLGATAVTVASGATLAVTPGVLSATNATGGSLTLSTGSLFTMADSTTSTFTVNGAAALGQTALTLDLGGTTTAADRLTVTGAATITNANEKISINAIGSTALSGGPFTIISGGTGSTLATNPFSLGNSRVTVGTTAYGLSLTNSAGSVVLNITGSGAASAYWTGNQGINWNATSGGNTNWATTLAGGTDLGAQPGALQDVYFAATGAINLTTNVVNAPYTLNSLNFLSTTGAVTIGAGSAITLNAGSMGNVGITDASSGAVSINTPLVLGGVQTWTNSSASALTINGTVNNGGFGLTTAGGGNITVNGVISGSGMFIAGGTGTTTLAGNIASTGGLVANTGILALSGANTFSTSATVNNGGTLQLIANSGNTAAGVSTALTNSTPSALHLNLNTGSTLQLRADNSISGNVNFSGTSAIGAINNITTTIDVGQISGTGGNTFTISTAAASPYGNAVTINVTGSTGSGNSLAIGSLDSITGAASVLTLNPTTATISLTGAGGAGGAYYNLNNGTNSSTLALSGTNTGNTIIGAIINQGTGSTGTTGTTAVTKSGTSTWTLSGANTYTGATTLNGGTLVFSGAGTLPTSSAITIGGASTLNVLNNGAGSNGSIAQGNGVTYGGAAGASYTSTIFVDRASGGNTGNTIAFGALSMSGSNYGITTNFTGADGYLVSFTNLALPGTTGNTTTLNPTSTSVTFTGNVTNSATIVAGQFDTLQLSGTSTGNVITGVIADAAGGSVTAGGFTPVAMLGTGSWKLLGANTYTGNTTVSSGNLILQNAASIGGSLVSVAAGGTLTASGNVAIGNGTATLQATQGTVSVAGSGTLSLLDGTINTLTIKGNNFATPPAQILTLGGASGGPALLNFETGNNSTDQIVLSTGTSTKILVNASGAQINLTALSGTTLAPATYSLITFGSGSTFTGAFTLGAYSAPGMIYTLNNTGTVEQLIVTTGGAGAVNLFWNGSGTAWTTASSFDTGYTGGVASAALPSSDTNVFFTNSTAAANFTSTPGQSFAINSLSFTGTGSPAGTNPITINGTNPITLTAGAGFTDQNSNTYAAGIGLVVQAGSAAHIISASFGAWREPVVGNRQPDG